MPYKLSGFFSLASFLLTKTGLSLSSYSFDYTHVCLPVLSNYRANRRKRWENAAAPAYFASGKKSRRTYTYSPHFAEFSLSEIAGSVRRRPSLRRAGERTWMTDRRRQLKSILPTHPHTVPRARPLQNFKVIMRKRSRRRSSGLIKASSSPIFRYAWEGGTVGTFEEGEEESGKKESRRQETKRSSLWREGG